MTERKYRKRCYSSSGDEDNELTSQIENIKKIQKIRKDLKYNSQEKKKSKDVGEYELCDPKAIFNKNEKMFGDVFAQETTMEEEDAEMKKFIERELAKRIGIKESDEDNKNRGEDFDIVEDILKTIPESLKPQVRKCKEDMVSNQMLCGIPEVDLGVEAKMKNIIATEEAKQKLMKDRWRLKHNDTQNKVLLVPKNVSVNFAEQSRAVKEIMREPTLCADNPSNDQLKDEKDALKKEKSSDVKKWEKFKHQQKRIK